MLTIFHTETYDYLIQTRELFDNTMTFKEKVYYTDKLKLLHIDAMFNDRDQNNIARNRKLNHRQHLIEKNYLSGCCKTKKKDYNEFCKTFSKRFTCSALRISSSLHR